MNMFYVTAAVIMHEAAHYAGACIAGFVPDNFVLRGFGIELCTSKMTQNSGAVVFCAACGPMMSIVLAGLGYKLKNFDFFAVNSAIAAINFLPVLPLDGGQIAYSIMSGFWSRHAVHRTLRIFGITAGAALGVCGLYILCISGFNFSLLYMGLFILLSNINRVYNPVIEITSAKRLDFCRCNIFMVDENQTAVKAAGALPSNAVGAVRGADGKIHGFVTPCYLYQRAEICGSDILVKDTLK